MGDCVMETTLKFLTTPLMLKCTLGVVIGVVGIVVERAVEDRVVDRVKVDRRLDLQGRGRIADDDLIVGSGSC